MDWFQFISSMVGSLAWPAVVAYLLYLLRAQLASLAARLTELSLPGGTKATFSAELSAAKTEALNLAAKNDKPPTISNKKDELLQIDNKQKDNYDDNRLSPKQLIIQRALDVNNYMKKKIDELPLEMRREPWDFVYYNLYEIDGGKELYNTFRKIRDISAAAYNSSDVSIKLSEARSYEDICSVFLSSFDRLFNEWLNKAKIDDIPTS